MRVNGLKPQDARKLTMDRPKMICPDCGAEMNHHAMKIDYSVDEPASIDPAFAGVVQEAHTCPECGRTAVRRA